MAAGLMVTMLGRGPLAQGGMNEAVVASRVEGSRMARALRPLVQDLEGPGVVYLAIDAKPKVAHIVRIWADRFCRDRSVALKLLAHRADARRGIGAVVIQEGPPEALWTTGAMTFGATSAARGLGAEGGKVPTAALAASAPHAWVALVNGEQAWVEPVN